MIRDSKKTCYVLAREEDPPTHQQHSLLKCAHLILPWLPPSSLASISSACKTLHHVSTSITTARTSDASRSLENHPIPFLNTIDSQPYSYFLYTPHQILPPLPSSPPPYQQWGGSNPTSEPISDPISASVGDGSGCGCENCGDRRETQTQAQCQCWRLRRPGLSNGELGFESEMMTECGPGCGCGFDCGNRVTQHGVMVRLRIVKDGRKGWGLYAAEFVRRGEFVCEYAGELLTTEEARRRQEKYDELTSTSQFSSALLVVREHLPSRKACLRINIDATKIGNVARFINHSCDGGNLSTVLVRSSGALLPRLCFFAKRDILEGEELAFCYGDVRLRANGLQCFCGSPNCFGVLPSEQT